MPSPKQGETQKDYVSRCMGDSEMVAKFADSAQRAAVCHAYYRNYQRSGSIHGSRAEFAVLRGAEIMAAGTWNGREFTLADLQGIVASFEALGLAGRIPLKFGHDADHTKDDAPAYGWVERLWIEGQSLMADFAGMPRAVYDAIHEGLYKFVSVELLGNVKADTRVIPWVLDAVALLGATPPAVGILKDLQSLTLARSSGLQCEARVAFRRDDDTNQSPTGGTTTMTEQEIAALRKRAEDAEAETARQAAENLKLRKEQEDKEKAALADRVKNRRDAITKLFNDAVEAKQIDPAVREQFAAISGYDKDDAAALRITDDQVKAHIQQLSKGGKRANNSRGADAGGSGGAPSRDDGDDYSQMAADEELSARTMKLCRETGRDPTKYEVYLRASQEVLRSNKDLAERYKYVAVDRSAAARQ